MTVSCFFGWNHFLSLGSLWSLLADHFMNVASRQHIEMMCRENLTFTTASLDRLSLQTPPHLDQFRSQPDEVAWRDSSLSPIFPRTGNLASDCQTALVNSGQSSAMSLRSLASCIYATLDGSSCTQGKLSSAGSTIEYPWLSIPLAQILSAAL